MIVKKAFSYIAWIIVLYLFIFQPTILSKYVYIGIEFLLFVVAILFKYIKINDIKKLLGKEIRICAFLIAYAVLWDIITEDMVFSDRTFAFLFQGFFCSYLIIKFASDRHVPIEKLFYITCLIGAIISTLMVFVPSVDSFYQSIAKHETIYEQYENFDVRWRGFGASENITFTYAVVMGFCSGLSLLMYKKIYHVLFAALFALAVMYNARIGFVPIILFIVYMLIIDVNIKLTLRILLTLAAILIVIDRVFGNIFSEVVTNAEWSLGLFTEISSYLAGDSQGASTINTLTGDFIVLPDSFIGWIFGSGESLFNKNNHNSDIGYVIQLYYGGIFFLFGILYFMYTCSTRLFQYYKKDFFPFVFTFLILILNYKGYFFAATPGARFLFAIYVLYLFNRNTRYSFIQELKNNRLQYSGNCPFRL